MIELAAGGYAARLPAGDDAELWPQGLFAGDTRVARSLEWRVVGVPTEAGAVQQDGRRAVWADMPPTCRNEPVPFAVEHHVALSPDGWRDDVRVTSMVNETLELTLRFEMVSDMADQFALRLDSSRIPSYAIVLTTAAVGHVATVTATGTRERMPSWQRCCRLVAPGAVVSHFVRGHDAVVAAVWVLQLEPFAEADVAVEVSDPDLPVIAAVEGGGHFHGVLSSLLINAPGTGLPVVAAGVPWFITLFGRDSLWSAFLARHRLPWLLDNVVRALAHFQGSITDAARQEEPGKIVHEVRSGAFAVLDLVPYARYYGGVDTTPLWLMMLSLCEPETRVAMREHAKAAVAWILGPGGIGQTGFVRYSADEGGLVHQGWKDSGDAVLDDDGGSATQGVALVEVQGYAYAALIGAARMAADDWDDPEFAAMCARQADALRERFIQEFVDGREFPAMAVLADGQAVTAVSSNAGHLLLTGILSDDVAAIVARRLLMDDVFTGYGIRTLGTDAPAYSPSSYHRGSVWPHDTAVCMMGMQQAGLDEEARIVAGALLRLAGDLNGKLPEYIVGLRAGQHLPLVPAQSAYPQAWAAAAALAAQRVAGVEESHGIE